MFLSRQNYKIRAYIGTSTRALVQYIIVLDTGAGSSFVKKEALSPEVFKTMKPLPEQVRVRDANNRRLNILGTVELNVQIGNRQDKVNFYVVERLATDFILGCDFCDKHVEAIKPRKRLVELDDGTTIPLVRGSKIFRGKSIPVPSETPTKQNARAASSKIVTTEDVTLPANSQCWVKVKTAQHGLIHVQPVDKLYANRLCLAGNGIAQVETGKQFGIFVANFGKEPQRIKAGTKVATAKAHPKWIKESEFTHADMLGIVEDATENKYKKRQIDVRDVSTINQYLSKLQKTKEETIKETMRAEDVPLEEVPEEGTSSVNHDANLSLPTSEQKKLFAEQRILPCRIP